MSVRKNNFIVFFLLKKINKVNLPAKSADENSHRQRVYLMQMHLIIQCFNFASSKNYHGYANKASSSFKNECIMRETWTQSL